MFTPLKNLLFILFVVSFAVNCSGDASYQEQLKEETQMTSETNFTKAVAVIHPTEGHEVSGVVTFEQMGDSVRVHAEIEGLTEGQHGFHIHQYGDCTAPDLSSAGGHYNPANNQHAAPTDANRHMGDMGNIEADAEGNATLDYVDNTITLNGSDSKWLRQHYWTSCDYPRRAR
jgi:Cu-Zn family superoxide dismutase